MGLPWIQVEKEFLEGRALNLSVALRVPKPQAAGHMAYLWKWASDATQEGVVEGQGWEELLARAAEYDGPPRKFVRALLQSELAEPLESRAGCRVKGIDRYDEAKAKIEARHEADAERKRKEREAARKAAASADIPTDESSASDGRPPGVTRTSAPHIEKEIETKKETELETHAAPPERISREELLALMDGAPEAPEAPPPPAPKPSVADARKVFDYWVTRHKKDSKKTLFTKRRRRTIEARLKEGRTVDDLFGAIDGCAKSLWHMGSNPEGKLWNDLELILREDKVERFMELGRSEVAAVRGLECVGCGAAADYPLHAPHHGDVCYRCASAFERETGQMVGAIELDQSTWEAWLAVQKETFVARQPAVGA